MWMLGQDGLAVTARQKCADCGANFVITATIEKGQWVNLSGESLKYLTDKRLRDGIMRGVTVRAEIFRDDLIRVYLGFCNSGTRKMFPGWRVRGTEIINVKNGSTLFLGGPNIDYDDALALAKKKIATIRRGVMAMSRKGLAEYPLEAHS